MYYDGGNFNEPYRKLMCAILDDAYRLVENYANSRDPALRLKAMRAWEWFESEDMESVFSFLNICGYLDLDPDPIRKKLTAIIFRGDPRN